MKIVQTLDTEHAAQIKKEIRNNNGYCPCNIERTPDTKCICKSFRDMVKNEEVGKCHCGLYLCIAEE